MKNSPYLDRPIRTLAQAKEDWASKTARIAAALAAIERTAK